MRHMRLPDPFSSNLKVSEAACVNAECGCMGYGRHMRLHSHPTSKVSEAACVVISVRVLDAWVWMRHMRLPDPFSSNLRPLRLHVCECGSGGCMGMDAPHATACYILIQPPRSVRLHVCVDAGCGHGYGCATCDCPFFIQPQGPVRLHVCGCGSVDAWVWMRLMRPPDPFSSNGSVRLHVWMQGVMHVGMDAARLPDPFSSNQGQ
jgi:hypothetical protein